MIGLDEGSHDLMGWLVTIIGSNESQLMTTNQTLTINFFFFFFFFFCLKSMALVGLIEAFRMVGLRLLVAQVRIFK